MQYILHDLLKLPLEERLTIIEKVISSCNETDEDKQLANKLAERLKTGGTIATNIMQRIFR